MFRNLVALRENQEIVIMKKIIYLHLIAWILAPGFVIAQDAQQQILQEPAVSSLRTAQNEQGAQNAPADSSLIALNAFYAQSQFLPEPNLSSELKKTGPVETGIIEGWRERIFNSLQSHYGPIQQDPANDSRLLNNSELDAQADEKNAVARLVLKETLQYTQERVPEIDRLVKALKFEFSTENADKEDAAIQDRPDDKTAGEKRVGKKKNVDERLFVKTGLRIPIESGKLALVSETEARYHKLTSFITVRLDGQYDNSMGVTYILGKDIQLRAERQVAHTTTTDTASQEAVNTTSSLNLVQLVCKF
jgi:hypothetical protein